MSTYEEFLASKIVSSPPSGFDPAEPLGDYLFPFQADLVRWSLRRGKAALFAQTGLGKTRMTLEWARLICAETGGNIIVLAPLSVATQTANEAAELGIPATLCGDGADIRPGINITNYDRLHRFGASLFVGVVCDESSCIKHHNSATFDTLVREFRETPYKLCATATPAPNDWTELGTHAEFLGICTRAEMLSEYFVHDGGNTSAWRLKGHAREAFWRWVSSWAALVRKPSDLGYDDGAYELPPLNVQTHVVEIKTPDDAPRTTLFALPARGLTEQRKAKRESLGERVRRVAELVRAEPGEPWVVWCHLNDEQDALERALAGEAVSIRGADSAEEKEDRHGAWLAREKRVLISKPSIFGWGLNWQHCARMAFAGINHSYEELFQSMRRCWRFGQKRPVNVHMVLSRAETEVLESLQRKAADADDMGEEMQAAVRKELLASMRGLVNEKNEYDPAEDMVIPPWLVSRGVQSAEVSP